MKTLEANRAHLFDIAIAAFLVTTSINCSAGAENEAAVEMETKRQDSSAEPAEKKSSSKSTEQTTATEPEGKAASSKPEQQEASSHSAEPKSENSKGAADAASNPPALRPSGRTRFTEMKLSGSMCMSCLHEVERKLKLIQGVSKAKIEYPGERYYDYYQSPGLNSWARLTLSYDPGMIDLVSIKAFLRNQGYHPFKVVEKEK